MKNVLAKNNQIAAEIYKRLSDKGIFTLNLMGSPGSGKTSLLEKTIAGLKGKYRLAVIEGDLFTAKDAQRIRAAGVPAVQINTGGGCHLDASMVERALPQLPLDEIDLLIIENVGNLVCPAEFELGEDCKAIVYSAAEGEDKPLKYPLMFKLAAVVVLNKMDILPYTCFDLPGAIEDIAAVNPSAKVIETSCRTNIGINLWIDWLCEQTDAKKRRG
jgi:hydrogenase nickel incorporation protein HypB